MNKNSIQSSKTYTFLQFSSMYYSEIYQITKALLVASNIDPIFLDRHETLYYDESGNDKHLVIKDGKLNTDISQVFVLGGIEAKKTISVSELKTKMGKSPTSELKAKDDLKGAFLDILLKDNMRSILELIIDYGWHVHFVAVQILYYGFVDIVDSIDGLESDSQEYKAILYEILKRDPSRAVSHFKEYKYPNIKDSNKTAFLNGLIEMVNCRIEDDATRGVFYPHVLMLKNCLEGAKKQEKLNFIQNEETHVWVSNFVQFYRQEVIKFKNKSLIFDEEKQVQNILEEDSLEIDGVELCNYSFLDSTTDAHIQVSDYVASILRKYIVFLDRPQNEVENDIQNLYGLQMDNFTLLNRVLKDSLEFNPVFVHFIGSIHLIRKFHKYIGQYG